MTLNISKEQVVIKELGDGLVLRHATIEDTEELVAFNAQIHGESEQEAEMIGAWTRDLMELPHPNFQVGDFTVVEDTNAHKIVSSMNLISQTWSYGGIPFGVGRPELVGTLAEYRNRGLVRAQFDVVHHWSANRGEMAQAITGIPYYYRLYGYEMGLTLGGGRIGYKPQIPKLKDDEHEPYQVRPAIESDLSFIASLYERASQRYLVNCVWNEKLWCYELNGKSARNINRMELRVIETTDQQTVGYLAHPINPWGPTMVAVAYEVAAGISMAAVTPSVVRYLYTTGEQLAEQNGKKDEFSAFGFWLGMEHPVYQVLHNSLPRVRKPYSWFVRVPDLPAFLRHITPVLEQRLSSSPYVGYTGELKLTFYRGGVRMVLEQGQLHAVEAWKPEPQGHSGSAAFPELTFLQLLFGYRSLEELINAFADCWAGTDEAFGMLNTLFPKLNSDIWPVA